MTKFTQMAANEDDGSSRRRIHLREISGDENPLETVGQDLRAARIRRYRCLESKNFRLAYRLTAGRGSTPLQLAQYWGAVLGRSAGPGGRSCMPLCIAAALRFLRKKRKKVL